MQTSLNSTDVAEVLKISEQFSGSINKIYLFGSFARGEETPDSDIDFYYVFDDGTEVFRTLAKIDTAIFFNDAIVREIDTVGSTVSEFSRACNYSFSLEKTVFKEGVLIYGR